MRKIYRAHWMLNFKFFIVNFKNNPNYSQVIEVLSHIIYHQLKSKEDVEQKDGRMKEMSLGV